MPEIIEKLSMGRLPDYPYFRKENGDASDFWQRHLGQT